MKNYLPLACTPVFHLLLSLGACGEEDKFGVEHTEQSCADSSEGVAEAFRGEVLQPDQIDAEIDDLFVRIGEASRTSGAIDIDQLLSVDAMLEAMESGGMMKNLNDSESRDFKADFRDGFEEFGHSLKSIAFDRHRIIRVESPSESIRVIFVQHYDTEVNITFPVRWWLAKTGAGWRVFDFQDRFSGLRNVEFTGLLISANIGGKQEPWLNDFLPIFTRMQEVDPSDPDQLASLRQPLEKLRQHEMPDMVRTFASIMIIGTFLALESYEEAYNELEAARDGGYQIPLWHYLMATYLIAVERPDDAIQELEKHAATFGWDSNSLELLSDYHLEAGRPEESRDAALRGLVDTPGSSACLASLAAASTPEQIRDPSTAAHFAENSDPEWAYKIALDYLIDLESTERALAIFEVFRAKHPDSELIAYYVEHLVDAQEATAEQP